jgi:hypothetical protein
MAPPKAPPNLGPAGRTLWHSIADVYQLRPDEDRLLIDAAREADLIEALSDGLVDSPLISRGSQGQPVIAPIIPELRQHRMALAGLLKSLKIPDADGGAAEAAERSERGRTNAMVRFGPR